MYRKGDLLIATDESLLEWYAPLIIILEKVQTFQYDSRYSTFSYVDVESGEIWEDEVPFLEDCYIKISP